MEVRPLGLDGVFEILPQRFGDDRGFFSETYKAKTLSEAGIVFNFVQDNHSYSAARGVVRGLHYQLPRLLRINYCALFAVRSWMLPLISAKAHQLSVDGSLRKCLL